MKNEKVKVLDWIETQILEEERAVVGLQAFGKLLKLAAKNQGSESFPTKKAIADIIHTLTTHAKTCADDTYRTFSVHRSTLEDKNLESVCNRWMGDKP